jgi:hypothetical protein
LIELIEKGVGRSIRWTDINFRKLIELIEKGVGRSIRWTDINFWWIVECFGRKPD